MLYDSKESKIAQEKLASAEQLFWRYLKRARLFKAGPHSRIWQSTRPVVSFTFDDFPRSAFTNGGSILRGFGAHGTYYACMGWMGRPGFFGKQDLMELIAQGHELGCHTYSHSRAREGLSYRFRKDIQRNSAALSQIVPNASFNSFSYPGGQSNIPTRLMAVKRFESCRGNTPGVCEGKIDLSYLSANKIYHEKFNRKSIENLIKQAAEANGWLIFYTHDVSEEPSRFGCTPDELRAVLEMAIKGGAEVLTVQDACRHGLRNL